MKKLSVFIAALFLKTAVFAQTTPSTIKKSETDKPAPATSITTPAKTNLKKPTGKKLSHHVMPAKKESAAPLKEAKETSKDQKK